MSRSGILIVAPVLLALASHAQAVSTWTQLNPKNINDQHLAFTFTARNQGQVLEFQVTVHRKSGELSRFLQAHLEINDGDKPVANCPVAAYRHDADVTYAFQVSPKYLEKSKFIFAEMAYSKMKDQKGQEKLMPMPAGDFFWFYLSDFAPAGTTRPTTQVGQAPDLEIRTCEEVRSETACRPEMPPAMCRQCLGVCVWLELGARTAEESDLSPACRVRGRPY